MHFIDIAANLTSDMFKGVYNGRRWHAPDVQQVLSRAEDAGLARILVTAGSLSMSREVLSLVKNNPSLFCTVGVHPTRAGQMYPDIQRHIEQLASVIEEAGSNVVAIGECGLDYDRTHFCSKERQLPAFEAQFQLAENTKLPMFLHDRNTGGDFEAVIQRNRHRFEKGVVHSFTGSMNEMQALVDLDLYIGLNGCSLKTDQNLQVAKAVPLDRIMLETDSPYCTIRTTHAGHSHVSSSWPMFDKKKYDASGLVKGRSEPCLIRQVCQVVAAIKQIPEEELARTAFNNTMRFFFPQEAGNMGASPFDLAEGAVSGT